MFKMKQVAAALVGTAMVAGASGAMAGALPFGGQTGPDPSLTLSEKGLFALLEQQVSVVAGLVAVQSCGSTAGDYPLSGSFGLGFDGVTHGSVKVDRFVVNGSVLTNNDSGTAIDTSGNPGGTPSTDGTIDGVIHSALVGRFIYDKAGAMLLGNADWTAQHGFQTSLMDEHIIKDFYDDSDTVNGVRQIRDNGLELITKKRTAANLSTTAPDDTITLGYPRAKWRQDSFYRQPNGAGIGRVTFDKVQIAPFDHPVCFIRLEANLDGDDPSELNIVSGGKVTVFTMTPP